MSVHRKPFISIIAMVDVSIGYLSGDRRGVIKVTKFENCTGIQHTHLIDRGCDYNRGGENITCNVVRVSNMHAPLRA